MRLSTNTDLLSSISSVSAKAKLVSPPVSEALPLLPLHLTSPAAEVNL